MAYTFGSISDVILCLLLTHSLPSLGDEQKKNTVRIIVSNMYIQKSYIKML